MTENIDQKGITATLKAGLGSITKFVAWVSAAASGLGLILTACGFIVKHAYLESMGIPRSVFEAKAKEYVVVGGNFIVSLFAFTAIGLLNLLLYAWWLVAVVFIMIMICWRCRCTVGTRLLLFSTLYTAWLVMSLSKLQAGISVPFYGQYISPKIIVAMFTALLIIALTYLIAEIVIVSGHTQLENVPVRIGIVFMSLMVLTSFTMLPYLKGMYATKEPHPIVEPLGDSKKALDKILTEKDKDCEADILCDKWQLIQMGEKNVILRNIRDKSIVIIPADLLKTFRLLPASEDIDYENKSNVRPR